MLDGLVLLVILAIGVGVVWGLVLMFQGLVTIVNMPAEAAANRRIDRDTAAWLEQHKLQVAQATAVHAAAAAEYQAWLAQRDQPPPAEKPASIFFKPGEPRWFHEYGLQPHITEMLSVQIRSLLPDLQRLKPQMFLGPAGLGKTLLAKVCANELRRRNRTLGLPEPVFIEVFPADLHNVEALDAVIGRAADADSAVVFIDEVHGLSGIHAHKLYELLENGRYPFRGDPAPTELPHVTLLAATTDYGMLHAALKRRWVKHYLAPADEGQLVRLLQSRGAAEPGTRERIVALTKFSGAPWEAIEIFELAKASAQANGRAEVASEDVEWVVRNLELDELGLRALDRRVIYALRDRPRTVGGETVHGASESDTCVLAGIDKAEYRETVRPRLMARGLLEIRPGVGQALTAKALQLYPAV